MSAVLAVSPTVNVLVAAATFTGTCISSLITGVLMKPPPTPANPEITPATVMAANPSGTRRAAYGITSSPRR